MKKKIIIILLLSLLTSGCWNYRELNEMAIVGAMGIDYNEKTGEFELCAQVFNAKKLSNESGNIASGGGQSPVTLYKSSGKTIHEALRKMVIDSPRKLYIGHMEVIIISENLARKYLSSAIDFLFRDAESRKDYEVVIAKGSTPQEILEILTPLDNIPSTSIMQTIKVSSLMIGNVYDITFDTFISYAYGEGIEGILPTITIIGNKDLGNTTENINSPIPKADLRVDNMAIFKKGKMLGYLNEDESIGYNFAMGNIKSSVISFPCDDKGNSASVELIKSKSKVVTKIKNNTPEVSINIKPEAVISEINCAIDLKDIKNIEKVKDMATKRIEEIVAETITAAQKKYNSDILGFGSSLYRDNYSYWKKNKDKWYDIFPNIKYNLKVNLLLTGKGSVITSTKEVFK